MRVKKIRCAWAVAGLILTMLSNFMFVKTADASQINFSQSILPVKFAYVDGFGQIQKVWSNVENKDSAYVLKFFEIENNREIGFSQANLEAFKGKECVSLVNSQTTLTVDFRNNRDAVEEIRTLV